MYIPYHIRGFVNSKLEKAIIVRARISFERDSHIRGQVEGCFPYAGFNEPVEGCDGGKSTGNSQ
jgi:hypothetical protein